MKPGRPKAVRFPIRRTEVVNGEETVRTVEDHTAVTCVQCGMPFEISRDTAYVSRDEVDSQIEMVMCPICFRRASIYHYYDQIPKPKPKKVGSSDVYILSRVAYIP